MEKLYFEDYEQFVCVIADTYTILTDKDDSSDLCVVAKYDDAKEIVTKLICMGYSLFDIHLCNPEVDAYEEEYYISLNSDGVWCERAIGKMGYLGQESSVTYIFGDCNSSILNEITSDLILEVCIGDCNDDELHVGYDDECKDCEFKNECSDIEMTELKGKNEFIYNHDDHDDDDDDLPGFTITKDDGSSSTRISFYSTDKELVRAMAEFYK